MTDLERELLALLTRAVRYLDHPDVKSIPFAAPSGALANRIKSAIAKSEGR
jgi:hypothetical protein